jgi:hypothetical protein
MVDVRVSAVIRHPRAYVAAFTSDPLNAPRWYARIRSAVLDTPAPFRAGSRVTFQARFLGRDLRYTYECTVFAPVRELVMGTAEGPFAMETSYRWEDVDGGTRMTIRNRGEPAGLGRWLSPLIAIAMRRAVREDLRNLRVELARARGVGR